MKKRHYSNEFKLESVHFSLKTYTNQKKTFIFELLTKYSLRKSPL